MKNLQARSEGAVALARVGVTVAEIAARLEVSRALAGHWLTGTRKPTPEHRIALRTTYAIAVEAWDKDASKPSTTPRRGRGRPPAEPRDVAELSVRARAERLGRMVQALLDDLQQCSTPQERARVMASAAQTLNLLGKITGETQEISEERIVKTPAWRRLEATLVDALRPWPEALLRVGEVLQSLGNA